MIWRAPKDSSAERRRQQRWRARPLGVMLTLLVLAAMGYGAAVVNLVSQETRLVFPKQRSNGFSCVLLEATRPTWRGESPGSTIRC
jgi:hypothetical protein